MWKVAFFATWIFSSCKSSSLPPHCPFSYRCDVLLGTVKPSCNYLCCTNKGWLLGQFLDLTPCWLKWPRHAIGQCLRGNCVSAPGGEAPGLPSNRPSRPLKPLVPSCNQLPPINGYVTACVYPCLSEYDVQVVRKYAEGTPCLMIAKNGKPAGPAGICVKGQCIGYDNDDVWNSQLEERVFQKSLKKCPDKPYFGRRALFDCHTYCKIGSAWYYGSYTSNTTCQLLDQNRLGWCCNGICHYNMNCFGAK